MGESALRHDGLIGYFLGNRYDQFHVVHMPTQGTIQPVVPPYLQLIQPDNFINLSCQPTSAAYITMLIDPRASVHATTGILPIKMIELPARYVNPALANMSISLHVGPLLSHVQSSPKEEGSTTNNLLIPLPAEKQGTWKWLSKQGNYSLQNTDQQARLSNIPYKLYTGLLQFKKSFNEDV